MPSTASTLTSVPSSTVSVTGYRVPKLAHHRHLATGSESATDHRHRPTIASRPAATGRRWLFAISVPTLSKNVADATPVARPRRD